MHEDVYIALITKKLNDSLSESEEQTLAAWIEEDQSHAEQASVMMKIWGKSANFSEDPELNMEADFAQVLKKTRPTKQLRWIAPAATIAILLGLFFFLRGERDSWTNAIALNEAKEVKLPDGSMVWLNSNSTLSYAYSDAQTRRTVKLQGEAFFDVVHTGQVFEVFPTHGRVEVVGTSFNVSDRNGETEVFVSTGVVKLFDTHDQASVVLEKNEKGRYHSSENSLSKSASTANEIAWKTNRLIFDGLALEKSVKDIGHHYNIELTIENTEMLDCPFTTTFQSQSLDIVLRTLQEVYDFNLKAINDSTFVFVGGICVEE